MAAYFADTSFWIGLSRKRDEHHPRAVAWQQFLARTRRTLVTTDAVLLEWLNAMSDVTTRRMAVTSCLRILSDSRIAVVPMEGELLGSALQLYRDRSDKSWSLTDCLSFLVMERRGLTEALTTDRDFEQAGLRALMLSQPSL